jgi:5-(carboxyamino)imidazole ribonucleotide mutase
MFNLLIIFINYIFTKCNTKISFSKIINHLKYYFPMIPQVSIIMGSTSDLPVMEEAAKILEEFEIPFEINALSAHRTPKESTEFAEKAGERGVKVIIAGAGGAAHLPGVIAASTPLPVIGVPIKASISLDGWDSILSILQMPPGVPVATVTLNGARNAALLALQMIATGDDDLLNKIKNYKSKLSEKIVKANNELKSVDYKYRVN